MVPTETVLFLIAGAVIISWCVGFWCGALFTKFTDSHWENAANDWRKVAEGWEQVAKGKRGMVRGELQ